MTGGIPKKIYLELSCLFIPTASVCYVVNHIAHYRGRKATESRHSNAKALVEFEDNFEEMWG